MDFSVIICIQQLSQAFSATSSRKAKQLIPICIIWSLCYFTSLPPVQQHTLYWQKYSLTHPHNWNQVSQSLPWPQVYKSKHLGMQTVSTDICERTGCSQELSEFQRGTVIGCHLWNKTSPEISLNIPQLTVNGIITKWKQLGTTATQPLSGRPHKMTGCGQQMLRLIVRRGR